MYVYAVHGTQGIPTQTHYRLPHRLSNWRGGADIDDADLIAHAGLHRWRHHAFAVSFLQARIVDLDEIVQTNTGTSPCRWAHVI